MSRVLAVVLACAVVATGLAAVAQQGISAGVFRDLRGLGIEVPDEALVPRADVVLIRRILSNDDNNARKKRRIQNILARTDFDAPTEAEAEAAAAAVAAEAATAPAPASVQKDGWFYAN